MIGPWETELLCRAIAHLATGNYQIGEDVMLQVERAEFYRSAKALASVANVSTLTVPEVRENVARVLQG